MLTTPARRQLLLALITVVSVGTTALVATASRLTTPPAPESWVGTWAMAPSPPGAGKSKAGFTDQTVRMFVHTSVGGTQTRIRLSNRYGATPLQIGHATVALPWPDAGPGDLRPGSIKDATFSGQKAITIPAGGNVISDPIEMEVPAAADLAVSIYLPVATGPATWHFISRETTYVGKGDNTASASGATMPETRNNWYYLTGVDVLNRNDNGTVVVLGDSITDGLKATPNVDHRWTDYLAARLNKDPNAPGVLNLGIAGDRFILDGADFGFPELGANASARFHSDVLAQTGVRAVIVQLGINDIWISKENANNIIAQIQQLTAMGRQAGLKVYVCTIMPWNPYAFTPGKVTYTPELDSVRLSVNSFIRTSGGFDGVVDLDLALRDPADPTKLRKDLNSGDHIHPNDAGNEAMASAVPLDLLLAE